MPPALQGDNVEAAGAGGPAGFVLQEEVGGKRQSLLLAPIDTGERSAELRMQPVADFDEYYCIGIEHDQIELATLASPVTRQRLQALPLQKGKGLVFSGLACAAGRCAGH